MLTILCGLIEEAQTIPQRDDTVILWGNARNNLDTMVPQGCTFLLSFGVSGALDPTLKIGDLIIPNWVVNDKERYSTFPPTGFKAKTGIEFSQGTMMATTPQEREELFKKYQANAIDDESIHVARFARKKSIRWGVIRAISDDTNTILPPWVLNVTDLHGQSSMIDVLKGLEHHPTDTINLIKDGINFERALKTLRDIAPQLATIS